MNSRSQSLYVRLVLRIVLVLTCSAAVLLTGIWITTQLAANEVYDRILTGNALQIAENTWLENGTVNVDVPLAAFTLAPGDQNFYSVRDPNGRIIAGDPELKLPIPWEKLADGPQLLDGSFQDQPVRVAIVGRRFPQAGPDAWAVVTFAQTTVARRLFANDLGGKALAVILAMGVLTVLAALFTLYQALSPLARIETAIRGRDPNDLSPLPVTVPEEISALVDTINAFMRRLSTHRALMRRVLGDAAHQLRTPITAQISQMELLVLQQDETRKQFHLERLRTLTYGLGTLVNQLINHAMVQHRSTQIPYEKVDLVELTRSEVSALFSDNSSRQLDLALCSAADVCWVAGDATTLREAIKNVVDNAMRYGAPTLLHVEIQDDKDCWRLSFIDDGPGIPEDAQARLRKPFSAREGGRTGASLGLSIVEEVMKAHHGALLFETNAAGYFVVTLSLKKFTRKTG